MSRSLLLGDRLAPPDKPQAFLEVIDPHPRSGFIKVFDSEKREERYIDTDKTVADLYSGRLSLLRKGAPLFSLAEQSEDQALRDHSRFVQSALKRVHDIEKRQGVSFCKAYAYAAEAYSKEAKADSPGFPSLPSMYRYRKCDVNGLPVLRGNKNKGNRDPRYPTEVIATICVAANQYYLKPQSTWSLHALTKHINNSLKGTVLPPKGPPISEKFVLKTITHHVSVDPEYDRMDPRQTVAGKSFAKKRLVVDMLLERVEQDALHLPFVVNTPSGVSSQVYLVLAIDCCTGYPLGWKLVVGMPTDADSLDCAEMYMSPIKAKHLKALGISHDMNVFGTPGQLVFDNGPETKRARILELQKLGIDVKHCRARAGQEKPYVERLNRSLKVALEGLPGCTRFDGMDGIRDPISLGDDLMTLDELELWVVRWLYEKWVHTPLERLLWGVILGLSKGSTPAERVQHFEDSCLAIPLPPSRTEWLATLYEKATCRVNRKTGITVLQLHYKGDAIAGLLAKYGESRPLTVLFNPDDHRHVYVHEGDDAALITLTHEHLRPETPAWSFAEAKEKLKSAKSSVSPTPEAKQFDHDMDSKMVTESLAPKKKKASKYDRNRETARAEKDARAIAKASKNPGPQPPPHARKHSHTSAVPQATSSFTPALGDAEALPLLDRRSGSLLK